MPPSSCHNDILETETLDGGWNKMNLFTQIFKLRKEKVTNGDLTIFLVTMKSTIIPWRQDSSITMLIAWNLDAQRYSLIATSASS